MMKKNKRVLAMLMALVMLMSLLPVGALAEGGAAPPAGEAPAQTQTQETTAPTPTPTAPGGDSIPQLSTKGYEGKTLKFQRLQGFSSFVAYHPKPPACGIRVERGII